MSFDEMERSNYTGIPIELYEFSVGITVWRYNAGQYDITLGGVVYKALAVSHEGFSQSGNPDTDELQINISADATVTQLYIGTPPSDTVTAIVRTLHRGDTEAPVVWSGTVKSAKQVSDVEWVLTCNSLLSTLNRNGLRLSWGRGCPHALYDRLCSVNPVDFETLVQISSLTGSAVTAPGVDALGNGYLGGGFLSFTGVHGNVERRAIETHVGNTIGLMGTTDGMSAGDWIRVYPGCDRVTATCLNKFNNLPNYGGFPHLPTKSPFDGDPVF